MGIILAMVYLKEAIVWICLVVKKEAHLLVRSGCNPMV
jgi:hypothetical protein